MADLKGFQVLNDKLQELNLQTIEAKNLLHEKRKCKNVASNFINNTFVDVVGHFRKSVPAKCTYFNQQVLNITGYWQRVHNGKWIIGICVVNTSERHIVADLRMGMKGAHIGNMGDMYLLTNAASSAASKPDQQHSTSKRARLNPDSIVRVPPQSWEAFTEMPPNATGYVIRILEAPKFMDHFEERISGVIFYSLKDDDGTAVHQANIPVLKLNAKEFAAGKYVPFSARADSRSKRDYDILSTMLSSEHTVLAVRTARVRESPSLMQALTERLNFEKQSGSLLFYGGGVCDHPELSGILIMLDPSEVSSAEHTLNVYARNDAQIYLLVHCLYAVLPTNTVIFTPKLSKPNASEVLQSLKSEQQLVWSYLRSSGDSYHLDGEPNKREGSSNFRETLSAVECRTDVLLMEQA